MKQILILTTIILFLGGSFSNAGYKFPATGPNAGQGADGEPIGQPRRRNPDHRPNLPDSPRFYPEDEIPASTKAKLLAPFIKACKEELGNPKWVLLGKAGQAPLKEAALIARVNEVDGPNGWTDLSEPERDQLRTWLATDPTSAFLCERARRAFICSEWEKLTDEQRKECLRPKLDAELRLVLGEEAFNDLSDEEKEQAREDLADTIIKNMRCNIETALKMIECICPEVARCLRMAWDKGRLCVDFKSRGAAGSMKVDKKGKAAGVCDPDSFPVNIALGTFPKRKITSCIDPRLYALFTTLLHEGVHTLQAIAARPDNPTAEQCADRYLEIVRLEEEAHGKENDFIEALCVPLVTLFGSEVPEPTGNDLVDKMVAKIAAIPAMFRLAFALPLKAETLRNKISNDNALAYYARMKNLANRLKAGLITKDQFDDLFARIRKVLITHTPQPGAKVLITAGGESNLIEQTLIDPETAEPVIQNFSVPVDIVTEAILIANGQFLITFGNEEELGQGVVHAFQDQNGDGFFDPETGQEIMRHEVFFGAMDSFYDDSTQRFVAVNLIGGDILELFPLEAQPVPGQFVPVGFMDLEGHAVSEVNFGDDASAFIAMPFLTLPSAPVMLPGDFFPTATSQLGDGQMLFLPDVPIVPFQDSAFLPTFVMANDLPILRPNSTINNFTDQLLISGPLGSQLQIILLPDTLLGEVAMIEDTRQALILEQPLVIGQELLILDPATGMESPLFIVQDPAPYFVDSQWIAGQGLQLTLFGIPGMEYQLLGSPDLSDFQPLGPPFPALDGPLVLPPDPSLVGPEFFWQAVTLPQGRRQ